MQLVFLLFCFPATHAVKHFLSYFITQSFGLQTFPEFVAVLKIDGAQLGYYDSDTKKVEFRQAWVKRLTEDDPQHLEWHTQACVTGLHALRTQTEQIQQHFNQTPGVHVLQEMTGCEWDDESGEVDGFERYGYDGDDFISLDLKTKTWLFTEQSDGFNWDVTRARFDFSELFITKYCPLWLEKYLVFGKSSLQRTDLPSVSLLQTSPSSPVSCYATGFYPDTAEVFWRKDGEQIHEDVDQGEILPNHDGTFQMKVDLNLSSVRAEDWSSYDCVFQLSSGESNNSIRLDRALIRTNWVPPSGSGARIIIKVVIFLAGIAVLFGLIIRNRFQINTNCEKRKSDSNK